MDQLLLQLCTYATLQLQYNAACNVTLKTAYNYSETKALLDDNQQHYERYGRELINEYSFSKELLFASNLADRLRKQDYRVPISSCLQAGYYGGNYMFNLKMEF